MKKLLILLLTISLSYALKAQENPLSSGEGNQIHTFSGHSSIVLSVAFSPDGQYIASGSDDKTIKLWRVSDGSLISTFSGHAYSVNSVAFSPDGQFLASGSGDYTIKLWRVSDGNLIRTLSGHSMTVRSVAFSPDGQYIASGSNDKTIKLWKVSNGKLISTISGHDYNVNSVTFSPDGQYLASGSWDKTIKIWTASDGRLIRTISGHSDNINSVTFSPDGQYLASGSWDKTIKLWRLSDGRLLRTISGHDYNVNSVAFSPDGQYLASGSEDKTIKLWKVNDGSLISTISEHTSGVISVAFSPDGQFIASGSWDKTIKLWDYDIIIYATVLQKKYPELFSPKGEFETTDAYTQRKQSANNSIRKYIEEIKTELVNEKERKNRELEEKIRLSVTKDKMQIENIGSYDADKEIFPITVQGKLYKVNVPLSEAPSLKQNWKNAEVSCIKKLKRDLLGYEYYNFQIIHPVTGSIYKIGEWKDNSTLTASGNPNNVEKKAILPPKLNLACSFTDDNGNGFLDAKEKGKISVSLTNSGKGPAQKVEIQLKCESNESNLSYTKFFTIDKINAGETRDVVLNISADRSVTKAERKFIVSANEANGFSPAPVRIGFETNPLQLPSFEIADYGINSSRGDNIIREGEITDFKLRIQNKGLGAGKNVKIRIDAPQNVFFSPDSKQSFDFQEIMSGAYADINFQLFTNMKVDKTVEVPVIVSDDNSSRNLSFKFEIDKPQQSIQEFIVKGKEQNVEIKDASGISIDIEKDIPQVNKKNNNAVALVISVSDYQNSGVPKVAFAQRDASLMRQYLEKTMGYDRKNILPQNPDELMTFANMRTYIKKILPSYLKPDGSSEVFVYYVGHGAPSTTEQEAFFVPYDCNPGYVSKENAYSVSEFYSDIKSLKAAKKIVVVDACFSGQAGNGNMLIKNASPLAITIDNKLITDDKSIVLQSSESKQVSNWYPEKQHSMFTYFLLKGIQGKGDLNGDGRITVDEIEKYINDSSEGLPYYSNREFQRPQRAVVNGSKDAVIVNMK